MARINSTTRIDLKKLDEWILAMNRRISIRVGIIGKEAGETHPGTELTNAQLGAVHEFGAKINVTDKMRKYLHAKGLHLKKETTTITIPARSFLREPIMGKDGKSEIQRVVKEQMFDTIKATDLEENTANKIINEVVDLIAQTALLKVQEAFYRDKIKPPTTPKSKQMRKYNPDNPTLIDRGELLRSITYEIKEM